MPKRPQRSDPVPSIIRSYAECRTLELQEFSNVHMRLRDPGITVADIWPTTGRYYVLQADNTAGQRIRGGERGRLPVGEKAICKSLDELFYGMDMR